MSSAIDDQLFNTWFVAIVVALVISLIAAALWDILRRRTWTFVSRFWPGVLREVSPLYHQCCVTRVEEEERQRAVTNSISALSPQIYTDLAKPPDGLLMAHVLLGSSPPVDHWPSNSWTTDYDVEAQIGMNPLYRPLEPGTSSNTMTLTAYFPDQTHTVIISRARHVINRNAIGRTSKRWKSSVVLQASLPVDPCVLTEIVELAKDCLHAEHRCTFQLGNWALLYYHAGNAHIHELAEGDVPVNVEARWQEKKAGITMSGLYLTGAQVKVATEQTSVTLRDDGPAAQGPGDLDELFFRTDQVDVPEDDSLIYASKVVQADGISLTVRSEASRILPPWEKPLREIIWGRLRRISLSAKKMIKSLLRIEDQQLPELLPSSGQDLEHNFELLADHWKGVSEIELLRTRKEVLYSLHELLRFEIGERIDPQPSCDLITRPSFIEDQHSSTYWQRGLHDLNQVIRFSDRLQNMDALQCGLHFSIRGGIRILLADFEGAIQDFDLACYLGHGSTIIFDRALAKSVLARYSAAMEDVRAALASNRSSNDIQELHTCLQQIILHQLSRVRYGPNSDCDHRKLPEPIMIPDLLTGDDWCPAPDQDDGAPPFALLLSDAEPQSSNTKFYVEVLELGGSCSGQAQLFDTSHMLLQNYADLGFVSSISGENHVSIKDHWSSARFMQEASILATISHPNIVHLFSLKCERFGGILMEKMDTDWCPAPDQDDGAPPFALLLSDAEPKLSNTKFYVKVLDLGGSCSGQAQLLDTSHMLLQNYANLGLVSSISGENHVSIKDHWSSARFMQEASILAPISHPNIVKLFNISHFYVKCPRFHIVMEKMNADLSSCFQRRKAFKIPEAPDMMLQLEDKKIAEHWGLTSTNMIGFEAKNSETWAETEYMDAKLADFEREVNSMTFRDLDFSETRWGVLELMQASDVGSSVGPTKMYPFKADVYSYSMTCYEILTGALPFESEFSNGEELRWKVTGDRPQLPQHCPPLLKDLIESCWSQDARKRPSFHDIRAEPSHRNYLLLRPCTKVDRWKEPAATEEQRSISNEIDQPTSRLSLSKLYNISTTSAASPMCPNRSTREDPNQEASASGSSTYSEQGPSN